MIQYDYIGSQFLGIYRDSKGYCGPKYTKIKKRNNGCKKKYYSDYIPSYF